MKKLTYCLIVSVIACMFALCVGCSQPASSSSASAASSGASASASASSSAASSNAASAYAATGTLEDGEYTVEVSLEGGTGRATVESPAKLMVADGKMTAVIVWSSPNYDLMVVDGEQFLPVPRAGNSTFEIPVSALDKDIPVQAETTAMSEPHMIDYTLHFDSSTLK